MTDDNPEPVNATFQVGYSDDGVVITWIEEESGHPHELALSPADAQALADALVRAVGDHTTHRRLIAAVDDSFPDDEPSAPPVMIRVVRGTYGPRNPRCAEPQSSSPT